MAKNKTPPAAAAPAAAISSVRWRRLERRLAVVKAEDPESYALVVTLVNRAAARNGLATMPAAAESEAVGAFIDFVKQLMEMLPQILAFIEMIVDLFS